MTGRLDLVDEYVIGLIIGRLCQDDARGLLTALWDVTDPPGYGSTSYGPQGHVDGACQ